MQWHALQWWEGQGNAVYIKQSSPAIQLSSYHYDGQAIRVSDTLRHVGVIFDRQLNFSEHVNSVRRSINAANILKVAAG